MYKYRDSGALAFKRVSGGKEVWSGRVDDRQASLGKRSNLVPGWCLSHGCYIYLNITAKNSPDRRRYETVRTTVVLPLTGVIWEELSGVIERHKAHVSACHLYRARHLFPPQY